MALSTWASMVAVAASAPPLPSTPRAAQAPTGIKVNPLRDAYFGDLHLHTSYSFDAFIDYGTTVDPDQAYRFAKGGTVEYLGQRVQRRRPLDFMAVTDHAESIGVFNQVRDGASSVSRSAAGRELLSLSAYMTGPDGLTDWKRMMKAPKEVLDRFWKFREYFSGTSRSLTPEVKSASVSGWQDEIEFANRNYEPGKFTAFIGYEWTSWGSDKGAVKGSSNLHRNVIFKGDSAPYPFSSLDSKRPEDLWAWLESIRRQGYDALAIPHNGNSSNGVMFDGLDSDGKPIDAVYAAQRQANEPLSEISQIKGQSETHPLLSPGDEFANYEILDFMGGPRRGPQGSYLREAEGSGLLIQRKLGINPYKYGFVGGADLHSGLSISDQADFAGGDTGVNLGGGKPGKEAAAITLSGKNPDDPDDYSLKMSPGSLTGVWAESNTRDSIYSALRRRETFATTGTELRFRFFGGWGFGPRFMRGTDWLARAYAAGVPMGGDLPTRPMRARSPSFAIWAMKDPDGANLDRVQVIKVWEQNGRQREKVYDVAWAGKRQPDTRSGVLPPLGTSVDLKTGTYSNSIGAAELHAVWTDPSFDPRRYAAYYLRVLEIPTPRWSTLLALEKGLPLPADAPATVQLRGWSSPIWYGVRHADTAGTTSP